MTKEQLNELVTIADLKAFAAEIITKITDAVKQHDSWKEFYTPKEFSKLTGMKYSTVIHYCNMGLMEADQYVKGGSWIIYRSEVEKRVQRAKDNKVEQWP